MNFDRIKFADGTLTIYPEGGGANETYNLFTNAITLHTNTSGANWVSIVDTTPEDPTHKSTIPFGTVNELAELNFGKIQSVIDFEVRPRKTSTIEVDYALAVDKHFYMVVIGSNPGGTIGTDDMRNGKANVNIFSLEGAQGVYLRIIESGGTKRSLEVGYYV